ncbi:MAG TPA: class I SAM-dependent methyltransferase [Solirubrobacteraceae bacterium]
MAGKKVVDLGPLEGAHSYMAEQAGAASVVGVEANRNAFLKCLVTKELLNMQRCSFRCGEVGQFLETTDEQFDVCIACGILYHMVEPVRLIDLMSRVASRLIVWTHVFDEPALTNRNLSGKLTGPQDADYRGFAHRVYRHSYGLDSRLSGFFGGTQTYSTWLPRGELLRALEHFGWSNIEIGFDEPSHPNGPALALVASRET